MGGIRFTKTENHENLSFPTFEKWKPPPTSTESIRTYAGAFSNKWFNKVNIYKYTIV